MESMRYAHNEGHTDVCYSDDSKFVITCGSEGDVRVWNSVDDVDQQDLCVGERAWAVAQKGGSLYVGTDNNTVQIYTFPKLTNDGIISRFTAPTTHILVSDDGKTVAACSCDMEIHVVDVDSMQCTKLIDHKGPVLSISLDPLQKYLVSSGCDGVVKVWSISSRDILKQWDGLKKSNSFENSEVLCRMEFNPTGQLLAIPFGEVVKVFERDSWNQVNSFSNFSPSDFNITKFSPCGKLLAAGTTSGGLFVWEFSSERVIKQESDLSKHAITGISWKGDSKSFVFCNAMGQLGNFDVPETSFSHTERESDVSPNDVPIPEPVFDDDDDDENVISLDKIKSQTGFHGSQTSLASKSSTHDDDRSVAGSIKYSSPLTDLQEPFQPSSTPLHLQQRFMVWNGCGIVRQFNTEGVDDIDIEYHDTTRNHGLRINNVAGHTMAALTAQAAVLACPKSEDGAPSKLVCVLMKSWDGSKEWDCSMPDNEEVIGVAAGEGWVAAICDSLILRLFTLEGTQVDVTSIPGPFVSATGSGQHLTVLFHSGVGVDSQQFLYYSEIVVDPFSKLITVVSTKPLPMTPKSLLRWVGYSDESSLCSLDSFGMLRLLYRDQWRPICSLDNQFKSKFDHYFVVGVSEMSQNIRCILCKGSFYPPVLPKPLVNEIKWQIPLCELESEKGKLEEDYLRNRIVAANINDDSLITNDDKSAVEKNISITIMKLFALACRSGLESRALTLCESMPTVDVVKLASKYAAKIGRQHLASKVNEFASTMNRTSYPVREEVFSHRARERTPAPVRPASEDIYSQDMFEDSEHESSVTAAKCDFCGKTKICNAIAKENENLIQKMQQLQKKKKESVSPKPMRILKAGNPFKKAQDSESRNNVSLNDSTSDSKQTFMEWYEENRHRLQEESPLLKEGELAVAAMKQYRQRMQQSSSNPLDDLSQSSNKSEGEFRQKKASDEAPKKKRSAEESPVDSELRKRKADSQEDDKPKKKPNSFSKLKAFSFTKTS